jgi:hypothetical protein
MSARRACRTSTRRSLSSRHRSAPTRDRLIGRRQRSSSQSSRRAATQSWRRTAEVPFRMPSSTPVATADGSSADNTGQPGSRAAANRVTKCAAPERRGERRAGQDPARPGAGESWAHAPSFPGRRLRDEPAGAARRLRQRGRKHYLGCRSRLSTPIHFGSTGISRRPTSRLSVWGIRLK